MTKRRRKPRILALAIPLCGYNWT